MSNITDSDSPKRPWLHLAIPILIVACFASLFLLPEKSKQGQENHSQNEKIDLGSSLNEGGIYYVFASEIELESTNAEDEPWDAGENGPDIKYRILWKGNQVFQSEEKDDSLIADWSGLSIEFDLSDLAGKTISTDEAIKAARIRHEKGGVFELVIEDEDVFDDDVAGRVEIKLDELKIGQNKRTLTKTPTNAVKRINLQVLPQGSSLKDLVELMR
jgi:hypothetical protein